MRITYRYSWSELLGLADVERTVSASEIRIYEEMEEQGRIIIIKRGADSDEFE